jgi:hypothetical protein
MRVEWDAGSCIRGAGRTERHPNLRIILKNVAAQPAESLGWQQLGSKLSG